MELRMFDEMLNVLSQRPKSHVCKEDSRSLDQAGGSQRRFCQVPTFILQLSIWGPASSTTNVFGHILLAISGCFRLRFPRMIYRICLNACSLCGTWTPSPLLSQWQLLLLLCYHGGTLSQSTVACILSCNSVTQFLPSAGGLLATPLFQMTSTYDFKCHEWTWIKVSI